MGALKTSHVEWMIDDLPLITVAQVHSVFVSSCSSWLKTAVVGSRFEIGVNPRESVSGDHLCG